MPRVFGVGLPKTGTRSLAMALRILGYDTVHDAPNFKRVRRRDAAVNAPVSLNYKLCDCDFPGAKFILTIRRLDEWLQSCERHFHRQGRKRTLMGFRKRMFGCKVFDAAKFMHAYWTHNMSVQSYFMWKPNSLLILDIDDPQKWSALCDFLGLPVPNCPYPHKGQNV